MNKYRALALQLRVLACGFALLLFSPSASEGEQQPTAKIVGIGATPCAAFLREISNVPAAQKDYLAWAQGFMNGVLISRPPGVDERLDLLPATFSLVEQFQFLRERCAASPNLSFYESVLALYKKLRELGRV